MVLSMWGSKSSTYMVMKRGELPSRGTSFLRSLASATVTLAAMSMSLAEGAAATTSGAGEAKSSRTVFPTGP